SRVSVDWGIERFAWRATQGTVRSRVMVRDAAGQIVQQTPWTIGQSSATLESLGKTGKYTVSVDVVDLFGESATSDPATLGVKGLDYWLLQGIPPVVLLGAAALMLFFYPVLSRKYLTFLGYTWHAEIRGSNQVITVRPTAKKLFDIQRLGGGPYAMPALSVRIVDRWPPSSGSIGDIRREISGDNVHVYVQRALGRRGAAEQGFNYPWAQWIGGSWSDGQNAVIAGQLVEAELPPRWELQANISF